MFRSKRMRTLTLGAATVLLASAGWAQMRPIGPGPVMATVARLKPGEFLWLPEIAPAGPMLVVVNIATQRAVAYRNGVPIAVSTVSTGRPGHRTPLGIFTVLQKRVHHRSSTYDNAPMPFMQRLTWRGIAMHGGTLPGYPASHGCIRLPHDFARLLFAETALGMTVVIVDRPPQLQIGPSLAEIRNGSPVAAPALWRPDLAPHGPVSIIVSGADRRMLVLRNGVMIGSAPVTFDGVVDSVQAWMLQDVSHGAYRWKKLLLPGQTAAPGAAFTPGEPAQAPGADPFREALATVVGPGTTLVVIPDSLGLAAPAATPPAPAIDAGHVIAGWRRDARVARGR